MKIIFKYFFVLLFCLQSFSVNALPDSFADLVEELIPSVVSIASTTMEKNRNKKYYKKYEHIDNALYGVSISLKMRQCVVGIRRAYCR